MIPVYMGRDIFVCLAINIVFPFVGISSDIQYIYISIDIILLT